MGAQLDLGRELRVSTDDRDRVNVALPVSFDSLAPWKPSLPWVRTFQRLAHDAQLPVSTGPERESDGQEIEGRAWITLTFPGRAEPDEVEAVLDRIADLLAQTNAETESPPSHRTEAAVRDWWAARR
jgi:hypothetical protein